MYNKIYPVWRKGWGDTYRFPALCIPLFFVYDSVHQRERYRSFIYLISLNACSGNCLGKDKVLVQRKKIIPLSQESAIIQTNFFRLFFRQNLAFLEVIDRQEST